MDLRDSPQEAEFRTEAREFLAGLKRPHLPDYGDDHVEGGSFLTPWRAWQRMLYDGGWGAITWPAAYKGRGRGPIEQIIFNQELSRLGVGESLFLVGLAMAGPTLIAHGTPEQKERHLAKILAGEEIWCQLFSEPGAGSDLAAVSTRAERDGDSWVVTGQKTWCSGGEYSDWGILLARTDPTVPKHAGITYFLLDMKSPGVETAPLRQMSGGAHFNEIFLNEVRIPDSCRLDEVGAGWKVANTTLVNERMAMGGLERFSWEALAEHARENAGQIDGVVRDDLGRLYCWMKALELLNARVITKLGRGQMPAAESSVMKMALARVLTSGSDLGLRLQGPGAMARRGFWQNQFLIAPAFHIAGGTDEIQKNICAERVLGMPVEPRSDRDVAFQDLPRS
jgi:acyl-CoA dehydrogenase